MRTCICGGQELVVLVQLPTDFSARRGNYEDRRGTICIDGTRQKLTSTFGWFVGLVDLKVYMYCSNG